MKWSTFAFLCLTICFQTNAHIKNLSTSKNSSVLKNSIIGLIDDCGVSETSTIHLINVNNSSENLKKLFDRFAIILENYDQALKANRLKKAFSIIFVDNFFKFMKFCELVTNESFRLNGYFLVVLKNESYAEMEQVFITFWNKFVFNVNVLVMNKNYSEASLFTFMPFSGKICHNTKPLKINKFDENSMKWSTDVFFPKKFKNLQKCSISAGTFYNPPGTIISLTPNGTRNIEGFEVEFLRQMGSSLNFSLDIKIYPRNVGLYFKNNKTATGILQKALTKEVDLIFGFLSLQQLRTEFLSDTKSFYNDKIVLVVPESMLVGAIRKLLIPFDLLTWIGILFVLFLACITITALKYLPLKNKNFIIGRNINNNILNLFRIALGGAQRKLPSRNFSRFLLISFVMFCLVVRSSYIGSLFNIIKNDKHAKELTTMDELDKHEYTFYIYESLAARLVNETGMRR